MIPIYQIEIKDHCFVNRNIFAITNERRFIDAASDGIYDIYIEKHSEVRYGAMDRYYWGVIIPMILEASGSINSASNRDDLHDYLVHEFGYYTSSTVISEKLPRKDIILRYSKMTVVMKFHYIDIIRIWATGFFGIVIPDPDPEWKQDAK